LYEYEAWSLTLREHRWRVFENRVLRRIFGSKRDEVIGWRKLHNEEHHNLQSLPDIVRLIKSSRMRRAGHVACMEMWKFGRNEGRRPPGRVDVDRKIIFNWISKKYDVRVWTAFIWLKWVSLVGLCEHSYEPLGSLKFWQFLE
jgi:hypothetical protein